MARCLHYRRVVMAISDLVAWASSGAMLLTGQPGGPPRPEPSGVAVAARSAADDVAAMTARFGKRVDVDGPALLGERAAIAGFERRGSVSVGGFARFERGADGWVVLNLPRRSDLDLLPALLRATVEPEDWVTTRRLITALSVDELVARGTELGLAIARPNEQPPVASPSRVIARSPVRHPRAGERLLVVDLSALWAGPLAASLLLEAGARVVKVEARDRPDGARSGPRPFFDLLNAGKESVAIDLSAPDEVAFLFRLLAAADLVIEASRPRAVANLGVDPVELLERSGTSWVSITGHGRIEQPGRVGFGDDAAVAGGLWLDGAGPPVFVADAVADPLTGLAAAASAADVLASDHPAFIEVPLVRSAAWACRPPEQATVEGDDESGWWAMLDGERVAVSPPRGRTPTAHAVPLGSHDAALRAEFAGS